MKPETLRDVICALPCDGATTLAFLGALPVALLDATVYRSCLECGGGGLVPDPETVELGNDGEFHIDDLEMLPCPACKDASTAIVSAALREKADNAIEAVFTAHRTGFGKAIRSELLDAVLSTVLRRVRYAKDIGVCVRPGHMNIPVAGENDRLRFLMAVRGDTIAILEEAGKEGDK